VCGFIDYLIMLGSIDNQSKGGGFDRGHILRDERCCSFSVIYLAGGGIIPFLKELKLILLYGYKTSMRNELLFNDFQ